MRKVITYYHATESLDSVIRVLEVKPDDSILAVCSSGDLTFAIAENVGNIVSVDRSPAQVHYAQARKELLEANDWDGFLFVPEIFYDYEWMLRRRNEYFLKDGRLQRIADRTDSISFQESDIFEVARQNPDRFTKIYVSNVFGYSYTHPKFYPERMSVLANSLVSDGLIYITDYDYIRLRAHRKGLKVLIPETLQVDKGLTGLARRYEHPFWSPVVYKKMADPNR